MPEENNQNKETENSRDLWELRLYVAGQTPNCVKAFKNLKKICENELNGHYRIEVIDLLVNPELGKGDEIVAIPTLVRNLPVPVKKNYRISSRYRTGTGGAGSQKGIILIKDRIPS